ncbi:MAG: alpha/beta hydrolase, partial [Pseudomonadota bacterium]|nr:alpha/beta hydrolase [Pseudomonadota bacterium]
LAAQRPQAMRHLVIINSPHPATFLRDLQHDAKQQAASAYMNFLCRPDAESLLAENDFARLWPFFDKMGASDPSQLGGGWLTEAVRQQYREVCKAGLRGGCNYYRASRIRPATSSNSAVTTLRLSPEAVTVKVPTPVIWAENDLALPLSLLEGLGEFVPELRVVRVPGATHWIVHEQPRRVASEIEAELAC